MGFIDKYPYTDFHELNLDWILAKIRELGIRMDDFEAVNQITFGGNWSITDQYAAWTIVYDSNIAYISLKPVPAGIVITNTEYWEPVFDYAGLDARVTALEGQMSGAESDIDNLQRFNQFQDTKVLCIGDSYGMKISENWPYWLKQHMGLDSAHITNMCTGNAGFIGNPGYQTFYQQLQNAPGDKSTYTHILIVGGFNDAYRSDGTMANLNDVQAQMRNCAAYITANYPNAKVFCGCPAAVSNANDPATAATMRGNITVIRNVYSFLSGELGWAYMKGCEYVLHDMDYLDENDIVYNCVFHPNSQGNNQLSRCIGSYIAGGDYSQTNNHEVSFTAESGVTITTHFYESIENENLTIYTKDLLQLSFATPIAYNYGSQVKIATLDHECFFPNDDDSVCVTVKALYNGSVAGDAIVFFNKNSVSLWMLCPYGYTTNVSSLVLNTFRLTGDIRVN